MSIIYVRLQAFSIRRQYVFSGNSVHSGFTPVVLLHCAQGAYIAAGIKNYINNDKKKSDLEIVKDFLKNIIDEILK